MKKVALAIAIASLALAQTPDSEKKAEFEAASIRPAKQDGDHDIVSDNGLFRTHNVTLKRLIANAYNIDAGQVLGGSKWVDSDSYDINARAPEEFAHQLREKVPQMVQNLLASRFQLVIHREPRQVAGYALVVGKKTLKMERAGPDPRKPGIHSNNTQLTAEAVTMESFVRYLSSNRDIGKPVIDKTGLTDRFSFALDWMPEPLQSKPESSSDDRPSIFTAVQEQLGLKLEPAKVPILVIVVDHAEKPEAN